MKRLCLALLLVGCSSELQLFTWPADGGPWLDGSTPPDAGSDAGTTGPVSLGTAFEHTCAMRAGALYCWGDNGDAQLGLGNTTATLVPLHTELPGPAISACAGEAHTCALGADGSLVCWGKNLHGELGVGDFATRTRPTVVEGPRFVRIACGGFDTCGITGAGALYCWGDNFEGKLGQDDPFDSPDLATPTRVAAEREFRDVSVGQGHVCAVTREGTLLCWGRNSDGQLALGGDAAQVRRPTQVGTQRDHRAVAAGQRHTCALRGSGTLSCWGTDSAGSLGLGVAAETRVDTPTPVQGAQGYRNVRASWFHTCALRETGELWCWGRNEEGQLGLGDNRSRNVPTRVSGNDWSGITTGHFHSCGTRADGLACWGENDARGQLGIGRTGRESAPVSVSLP